MITSIAQFLDWFGLIVFAITGALVASRKQMDIVGFALLGSVTGIGGGTIRDLLLGATPVFWIKQPNYFLTCVAVSILTFFVAHRSISKAKLIIWGDAIGLALFSVSGAEIALNNGVGSTIAIAMGIATATFGGIIRDILGGEIPIILRREIYVTAALVGAATFVFGSKYGFTRDVALVAGFGAAFTLRAAAIIMDLSLPHFKNPN